MKLAAALVFSTSIMITVLPGAQRVPDRLSGIPIIRSGNWVSLFNGKDLDGWTQRNGTATFRVEDGCIVGKTAQGSPNSFLCSDTEYGNFELTFEVKLAPGLNSGVQIRSASHAQFKNGRVHGPQVEIEDAPGESGYLYSEGTGRGWMTKSRPIEDAFSNGRWNRFVVRANGERIQTWVNGQAIADFRTTESNRSGFVGLQVHSVANDLGPYEVRFRDLRIRQLD